MYKFKDLKKVASDYKNNLVYPEILNNIVKYTVKNGERVNRKILLSLKIYKIGLYFSLSIILLFIFVIIFFQKNRNAPIFFIFYLHKTNDRSLYLRSLRMNLSC